MVGPDKKKQEQLVQLCAFTLDPHGLYRCRLPAGHPGLHHVKTARVDASAFIAERPNAA